jgi:hypothetical protein
VIEIATDKELSEQEMYMQAALAEFTALRTEALQAYSLEWNIVALQLTATGVLFSFALTNHSRTGFLLIVPIVSYVLSGRYLRNDRVYILIGMYIRTDLSRRVPGLNYEEWYKKFPNPTQTLLSLAYGPSVFSGISIVALVWVAPYILFANKISTVFRWMLGIVWLLDLTATVISIITIVMTLTFLAKYESDKRDVKTSNKKFSSLRPHFFWNKK